MDWPGSAAPALRQAGTAAAFDHAGRTADALRAVGAALPPGLIDAAAWRRLLAAADDLPLTSGGGIECRLDDPSRADLAVRFRSDLPAELAQMDAACRVPGLRNLLQGGGLRLLWLELDLQDGAPPVASVFAGPGNPPFGAPADPPGAAEWRAIALHLWAGAGQAPLDALRAGLPDGAWIAYLGLLRGQERRAVVAGLASAQIPPLLDRLGWPGDRHALAPLLACARQHSARIALGLDLTHGIGADLGIELAPFAPDCWDALLAAPALDVPSGWCRALTLWPGEVAAEPDRPAALGGRAIIRRLNHLKLTLRSGCPARPKIYLYYGLLP